MEQKQEVYIYAVTSVTQEEFVYWDPDTGYRRSMEDKENVHFVCSLDKVKELIGMGNVKKILRKKCPSLEEEGWAQIGFEVQEPIVFSF